MRFLAVTFAISLPLEALLLTVGWEASTPFVFGLVPLLVGVVPALSMISAAVGAPLERKVRFDLGVLCSVLVFYVVAFWTGWYQLAMLTLPGATTLGGVLSGAYRLAPIAAPVVALVLFAGKRPSVFWESRNG